MKTPLLPPLHLSLPYLCVPEVGLAAGRLGKKGEQEKRKAVHQLSQLSFVARGSSEYDGQSRATGVIPVQAVMQRQDCIFTTFAGAPNKPGRGF